MTKLSKMHNGGRVTTVILSAIFLCAGCTSVSPAEILSSPSAVSPSPEIQSPEPIAVKETVTIKTAREWNDFAESFNEGTGHYADTLTVIVDGQLNFTGQLFTPLTRPFNGTIRGSKEINPYTEEVMETEKNFCTVAVSGDGFYNITMFEERKTEPVQTYSSQDKWDGSLGEYRGTGESDTVRAMFGIRCGDLTLENLVFSGIRAEELAVLFTYSADSLTLRNVAVADCAVRRTNALLACNAGRLSAENMLVSRCDIELSWEGGGLFDWVAGDASFRRMGIVNTDVLLIPDGGGSGYTAGSAGLLATVIRGGASFEDVEIYRCAMYTLNSVALCQEAGEVAVCSDILVDCGSFLGFPNADSMMGFPENNLLFGVTVNPQTMQNVTLRNSVFNSSKPLEEYAENCIAVTAG